MSKRRLPATTTLIGFGVLLSVVLAVSTTAAWQAATQPQPTSCGCNLWTVAPATGTIWPAASLCVLIFLLGWRVGLGAWRIHRREHAFRQMTESMTYREISHRGLGIRYCLVSSLEPFALTIGRIRPEIYLSQGLLRRLSGSEFRVVLRHERAHQRGFHPLWRWFAGLIGEAFAFVPWIDDLHQAAIAEFEIIADRAASDEYRDTATVARALLRVEGLHHSVGLAWSAVEARVDHLLEPDVRTDVPIVSRGAAFVALMVLTVSFLGLMAVHVARADGAVPKLCRETRIICAERQDLWSPSPTMSSYEIR